MKSIRNRSCGISLIKLNVMEIPAAIRQASQNADGERERTAKLT